ncbi:MAG TPA: outer membrane protein assembly factor BamE [Steroidobacteraceae bacterium]|nr:outer membrane protein assembly factor BamE [Steroidobacteraceae bacterium]
MRTLRPRLHLPLLMLLALAAGCLYRVPVQQGNLLDREQVSQLQTGMTRTQVIYLLGTPMVPDAFNNERWDYYDFFDSGRGRVRESRRITVWFKDDKVERIEDNAPPSAPAPGAAQPAG